uniref:Zinc transporter ZIP9 n=1 Tax=Geotrypetes seraphini TaxID=260995 RepID=A0A6P8R696_GEOSA|nr:zinc transporter ZIP9-A-like isoform X2 [Geotrypetes seraphini]
MPRTKVKWRSLSHSIADSLLVPFLLPAGEKKGRPRNKIFGRRGFRGRGVQRSGAPPLCCDWQARAGDSGQRNLENFTLMFEDFFLRLPVVNMDGLVVVFLISLGMFLGCFLLGLIPLTVKLSEKLHFVSVLGAGLLCGTALAIIIPEGIELLEGSSRGAQVPCKNGVLNANTTILDMLTEDSAEKSSSFPVHFFIGVFLVMGFLLMFIVDQIGSYCSYHDPRVGMSAGTSITATLGLVIHAAADGVALGAAVASSQVSVQVIVFFAIILHKAPAAFGLVSFLMHAGLEKKTIQKHLLAFSMAAPILAIATYLILSRTGGTSQHRLSTTGNGMLFSAGTFLYVAMVHVLPEISGRGQSHQHGSPEYRHQGLGVWESLTLIVGAVTPILLSLGLHDG